MKTKTYKHKGKMFVLECNQNVVEILTFTKHKITPYEHKLNKLWCENDMKALQGIKTHRRENTVETVLKSLETELKQLNQLN